MIKGTGQRLIPRKLLEWIKGLKKGEGASLNITTLTDSNGNPRFLEGDGSQWESGIEGLDLTYCKWSLSGTHLMLVCAGTIANGTVLASSDKMCKFELPSFILNKIFPVWSNVIELKQLNLQSDDWTSQTSHVKEGKYKNGIYFEFGAITLNEDRKFRIQFDLLIDTE